MIIIRTTQYFKPHFGKIQSDMNSVGFINGSEIYQYIFSHPDFLYAWLDEAGLSIKRNSIFKGNTVIGNYRWEKPEKNTKKS